MRPYVLFVGKRSRRRNVPVLLEAFARHRRGHPTHRLVFAGPDDRGPLPGPDAGTIRAGHVPEAVLRGLMADALALVYPSDYEGFGLPIVEALASGCPVVTLRNSALTEAGGDAPWYLDAPDPEALAHALHVLATDPRDRAGRVARGLAHVARFSRARLAREVKDRTRRGRRPPRPATRVSPRADRSRRLARPSTPIDAGHDASGMPRGWTSGDARGSPTRGP